MSLDESEAMSFIVESTAADLYSLLETKYRRWRGSC